jgi:NAD(P)-dependent dehydrogenase (short-subunit alcohol dehydrogenase family)
VGISPASLGEFMAVAIATHKPALFILASRSKEKMDTVIKEINTKASDINIKTVEVDLASQQSIRNAAEEIKALTPKLDVIINNAGVNVPEKELTKEGIELHFGTNHIGLFLLTNLLIPSLSAAAKVSEKGSTRIINLSSAGHRLSPIRFSDYNFSKTLAEIPVNQRPPPGLPSAFSEPGIAYSSFVAYGQSKTANILFSVSLNGKLKTQGIVSYSVHPGCA